MIAATRLGSVEEGVVWPHFFGLGRREGVTDRFQHDYALEGRFYGPETLSGPRSFLLLYIYEPADGPGLVSDPLGFRISR